MRARKQEDADRFGVSLACSDIERGHSQARIIIGNHHRRTSTIVHLPPPVDPPACQCSLESSSVTCACRRPYRSNKPRLVVAGGGVDVASGRDTQVTWEIRQ